MPPSTPGRLAPGMIATNISSMTTVPMFAGRNAVQRDAGRVGGEDLQVGDAPAPGRRRAGSSTSRTRSAWSGRSAASSPRADSRARSRSARPTGPRTSPATSTPSSSRTDEQRPRCPPATPAPWRAAAGASGRRTAASAGGRGWGRACRSRGARGRFAARRHDPASPRRGEPAVTRARAARLLCSLMPRLPADPARRRALARLGRRRAGARGARRRAGADGGVPAPSELAAWARSAGPAAPAAVRAVRRRLDLRAVPRPRDRDRRGRRVRRGRRGRADARRRDARRHRSPSCSPAAPAPRRSAGCSARARRTGGRGSPSAASAPC